MSPELNKEILALIKDIQKQLGSDSEVSRFVTSAVITKICKEKLQNILKD